MKINKKKILSSIVLPLLCIFAVTNIYWIANQFGINLKPDWFARIEEYVSAGGSIVEAFALVAGVTLPAWVTVIVASFGLTSA